MNKVLIIEDDAFLRKAYNNVLTKEGFEVLLATDGEEGLRLAKENSPDIVLLDMLMPKLDGIGFLEQIDLKTNYPNMKVIVFSNMSIQEKIDRALELGATDYKTKAMFSPKEMIQLIRDTLSS